MAIISKSDILTAQVFVLLLSSASVPTSAYTLSTGNGNKITKYYHKYHESDIDISRRSLFHKATKTIATTTLPLLLPLTSSCAATDTDLFTKSVKNIQYSFRPPGGVKPSKKPLPTHLDEINFSSEDIRGYQYGITVDPVRINSLSEFGTVDEVSLRVVSAEEARDGVYDVTLLNAMEVPNNGYGIDYISNGKRGKKHFCTRIFVKQNLLVVMTAQVKEDDYALKATELSDTLKTFMVE